MHPNTRAAAAALAAASLAACSRPTGSGLGAPLLVAWDPPATAAALELSVSAPDLPQPLSFRVPAGAHVATVRVPPGPARTFSARAVDALGFTSHVGEVTVAVSTSQPALVTVPLRGRAGAPATALRLEVDLPPRSADPEALARR